MDLDTIVFNNYTIKELLIIGAVAVVGLLILVSIIKGLFKKKETSDHIQRTVCPSCGWKGQVSRYAGRCPSCNQPLGDQQANKREG